MRGSRPAEPSPVNVTTDLLSHGNVPQNSRWATSTRLTKSIIVDYTREHSGLCTLNTVRAAVLKRAGLDTPYSKTKPISVEDVELEAVGPQEVKVKVVSAGLCHSDLHVIRGARKLPLPLVLGHECAGVVEEVGEGTTAAKKGDHVVFSYVPSCGRCNYCASGRPNLCDPGRRANRDGTLITGARRFRNGEGYLYHHLGVSGFSEYTISSENSLVPIRADLSLDKAALFGCAVLTGVGAVVNSAKVVPGTNVAVFGCGGVGLNIIQGASIAGALRIIAVDVVDSKLELAKKFGATDTVNAAEVDPVEKVKDLSGRLGVDYSFEAIGNTKVMTQAYRTTKKGGKTIVVGITAPDSTLEVYSSLLVDEERVLMGSYMGGSVPRRDVPRLIDLYLAGRLKLDELVSRFSSLEEVNEGFDALAGGSVARQLIMF
jgi:alcohol dehydrogenase